MHKYEVEGYFFGSKMRLQEGIRMGYDDSGLYLLVCLDRLTEKEIDKLRIGKAEFALYENSDILFLLARIPGVLSWSDAPFHIGLYGDGRSVPEVPEGSGLALTVYGVDATNGKIKSMRLIGLGTKFSQEVVRIMKKQQMEPQIDRQEYNQQLEAIYGMYTCEMMVERAIATYRTRGE